MEQHRCMGCMAMTENAVCERCGWTDGRSNEPHQLPVGYVLRGQYIIGRVLGQGGFGITYLGWDSYLDLPVAIKEFYPNSMVNRECTMSTKVHCYTEQVTPQYVMSKERFLREAKALARFEDEPAIVRIRNFFEENETAYIVMEYVRGTNLAAYVNMRGGRLSPEEALRILKPVMEALAVVHEADLVHRDISPDNIMLHPRGGAKLLDFGAVRSVENAEAGVDMARSTEAILKHGFAPMEQYQSRGGLGPWTDEYALCATIWYCLTGRIPEEAPVRMLEEIEIDWAIPGLTKRQQAALKKGMSIRARDRHGSIRELIEELYSTVPAPRPIPKPERHPVPEPVPKPVPQPEPKPVPQPMPQPAPRPVRKPVRKPVSRKWLVAAAGAAAVIAVVLLLLPRGWRVTDDGYSYYSGGIKLKDSWLHENNKYYHFDSRGILNKHWATIDGNHYYFGADGVMVRSWAEIGGNRYYFGSDGVMVTGLRDVEGSRYYFAPDGTMCVGWQTVNNSKYYFGPDGAMLTHWQKIRNKEYYFGDDGVMSTGWQTIDGKDYWFGTDGVKKTGLVRVGAQKFYLDSSGVKQTGWQTLDGYRYYMGADGVMTTGWEFISGKNYYFDPNGKMRTGWLTIDGEKFYLKSDGTMAEGWLDITGYKYYFDPISGKMRIGWLTYSGNTYYFGTDGRMYTGGKSIDGRWYDFDSSGRLIR